MSFVEELRDDSQNIIEELRELRQFSGAPADFWPKLLDSLGRYTEASYVFLLVQRTDTEQWRRLGIWPKSANSLSSDSHVGKRAQELAGRTIQGEYVVDESGDDADGVLLGLGLDLDEGQPPSALVFVFSSLSASAVQELGDRLVLVADVPSFYNFTRLMRQAKSDVVQFADTLDLLTLLNESDRFMAAAMTLCNELAARHKCDRVSLGWLDKSYVRLQAISHVEKFERKMEAVQALEAAMEEAVDQDEEVVWPKTEETGLITRDHEKYAHEQGARYVVSVPMRVGDKVVAVVTYERATEPFGEIEVRGLRLSADQTSPRLDELKRRDRWFGARFKDYLRDQLAHFFTVEHTFAKALGVLISLLLAFIVFGKWDYRVEGPFILRTDDVAFMPAPFDGYVDEVEVQVGDRVHKGELLLTLDTQELLLEEAASEADITRYSREAEKARAQNALADMRIASALKAQSQAQLDKVRYNLANARVTAPFDGVVVEGDLKRMLGAPVRKGDILFKVANTSKMYAEIDLNERDIHEVSTGRTGEIAFVSSPDQKFPIKVTEIDPAAVAKEHGNTFTLRADLTGTDAPWLRPGMSGISKVEVGERNILWIITHRTVDFLRLKLWW